MAEVLKCGLVVNKFNIQSPYWVHFQINTLEKSMNTLRALFKGKILRENRNILRRNWPTNPEFV